MKPKYPRHQNEMMYYQQETGQLEEVNSPLMSPQQNPYYNTTSSEFKNKPNVYYSCQQLQNVNKSNQNVQLLTQAYISQVTNTISLLMNQNSRMIEKLSNQNQILMKHFQNIQKIVNFQNSWVNFNNNKETKHQNLSYVQKNLKQQGSFQAPYKNGISFQKPLRNNYKNQQKMASSCVQQYKPKSSKNQNFDSEDNQNCKRIIFPKRGAFNYQKQSWVKEQTYVLNFLQNYLRHNVKQTVKNNENVISKKQIMMLYLQWKSLHKIEPQTNIKTQSIQQIMTNEIKVMFDCTTTHKGFSGLVFCLGQEENQALMDSQDNQIQSQAYDKTRSEQPQQIRQPLNVLKQQNILPEI